MTSFDTTNLFSEFGFSSTPKDQNRPNTHIRFVSDDEESDSEEAAAEGPPPALQLDSAADSSQNSEQNGSSIENGINGIAENDSIPSSIQTIDEVTCSSVSDTAIKSRFCQFLDKIGFKDSKTSSIDEKLDFVMKSYDVLLKENEKLKGLLASSSCESKNESEFSELFVVDTKLDSSCLKYNSNATYKVEYSHKQHVNDESPAKSKVECYNCDGDHMLSECKIKLDHKKIRAKKRAAYLKSGKEKEGKKRYAEEQTKFKPGQISQELRRALGLRSHDLPFWIYQMRVLGYPPGYLVDAFHEPSNIVMFDDDGCPTKPKNEKKARGYYDPNKIIDYPGFNSPLPHGVKDNCMELNMPPMLPHHQKEAFLQYLDGLDQSTCKNLVTGTFQKQEAVIEDMDIAEIDEKVEENHQKFNGIESPSSPGTDQLQKERDRILAELDSSKVNDGGGQATVSNSTACLSSTSVPSGEDPDESIRVVDEIFGSQVSRDQESASSSAKMTPRDAENTSRDREMTSRDLETTLSEGELESSRQTPTDFFRSGSSVRKSHSAKSLCMELGTPVSITPRSADQSPLDGPRYKQKPTFEAFANSIVKFEVQEENIPCRGGGMKRLKEILRKSSMKK